MWFFIKVPDAPDGWYVTYGSDDDGEVDRQYFIANIDEDRVLKLHAPDCRATVPRPGLTIVEREGRRGMMKVCGFETKQALLQAAGEAVELLSKPQIVFIEPFVEHRPVYDWENTEGMEAAPSVED